MLTTKDSRKKLIIPVIIIIMTISIAPYNMKIFMSAIKKHVHIMKNRSCHGNDMDDCKIVAIIHRHHSIARSLYGMQLEMRIFNLILFSSVVFSIQ